MMFIMILFIFVTGIAEGVSLVQKKQWREIITVGILLGIALYLVCGKMLYILSPLELLDKWISPLGKGVLK